MSVDREELRDKLHDDIHAEISYYLHIDDTHDDDRDAKNAATDAILRLFDREVTALRAENGRLFAELLPCHAEEKTPAQILAELVGLRQLRQTVVEWRDRLLQLADGDDSDPDVRMARELLTALSADSPEPAVGGIHRSGDGVWRHDGCSGYVIFEGATWRCGECDGAGPEPERCASCLRPLPHTEAEARACPDLMAPLRASVEAAKKARTGAGPVQATTEGSAEGLRNAQVPGSLM